MKCTSQNQYATTTALLLYLYVLKGVSTKPTRFTINCGHKDQRVLTDDNDLLQNKANKDFDVESFCNLIQNAIPKYIKNGKFVTIDREQDMIQEGNSVNPIFQSSSNSYVPLPHIKRRLSIPRLKLPTVRVPAHDALTSIPVLQTPIIRDSVVSPRLKYALAVDDGEERLDNFRKGLKRMLHVIRVFGVVDEYVSERARLVLDKLLQTFSE